MAIMNVLVTVAVLALLAAGPTGVLGVSTEDFGGEMPDPGGGFDGENIRFSFNVGEWIVGDIYVHDVLMIEKIYLPYAPFYDFRSERSTFEISASSYNLTVNDFSSPSIVLRAMGASSLKIEAGYGTRVEKSDSGLTLENDGISGEIVTGGGLTFSGRSIDVSMKNGDVLLIRFSVSPESSEKDVDELHCALSNAVSLRRLGAEGYLKGKDFSFVSYNDLSIIPVELEEDRMIFSVASGDAGGKSVFIHLSSSNLTNITVLLDGAPVKEGSYYDALFSTGNEALWNCTRIDGELGIAVYIPHFSKRVLTIEESQESAAVLPGGGGVSPLPLLGAALVSVFAAVILIWKRSERP